MLRSVPTGISSLGNYRGIDDLAHYGHEFDVAALLARLKKPAASSWRLTSRKGCGLSRPQPRLRLSERWELALPEPARSAVPTPLLGSQELRLRSCLGWLHLIPGTARHTNPL